MSFRRPSCVPSRCVLIAFVTVAASLAGCDKPKEGPKRADHAAAHTDRYHPDFDRASNRRGTASASAPADSEPVATSGPGPAGSPVLFINSESVSVPEILEPLLPELEKDAKTLSPQLYYTSLRRAVKRQIDLHVSTLLLYQEAKTFYPEKAMEALDKEADKRIKEIVTDRYQGVYARYEAQLKAMDLNPDDVKARIKRQILVTQYMRDKYKSLLREPPRRDLLKYYQDHQDEYTTAERAELLLIEVPVETALGKPRNLATSQEIEAARKKAVAQLRRAREELESGVEFPAVARAYSRGIKDAQGGSWGEVSPGTLQGRWAKAAEVLFTLSEQQISDVIEADEFVFLVKCGKRTPAQRVSFEEAQPKIIERIKDEQFSKLSQEHVESLLDKATVRPLPEFTEAVLAAAPRPSSPIVPEETNSHE